jgi:para-aminobenzoate synthetase component I
LSDSVPDTPGILFRDDIARQDIRFENPERLLVANDMNELEVLFGEIEQARRVGRWLAGYFSYDAGYLFEPKLQPILPDNRRLPLACVGIFEEPEILSAPQLETSGTSRILEDPKLAWDFGAYRTRFEAVHKALREGDCYQANLTFPITGRWRGKPLEIFHSLAARQPVRHSAYVDFGAAKILSRSPELFFETDTAGWIQSLPMKGTARRGSTPAADKAQKRFLQSDPKNQAENRMIVDLLRNDISLISETGTLDVPKLFEVETYSTVHQMVSLVRAKLLPDQTIREIFAALFPCGSITGAPKLSAMQILHKLEAAPRDIYCGSIGWMAPDGQSRFNVAIRTLTLFPDGEAVFNVGGGVVFDSNAEEEYAECLLKARFVLGDEKPGLSR